MTILTIIGTFLIIWLFIKNQKTKSELKESQEIVSENQKMTMRNMSIGSYLATLEEAPSSFSQEMASDLVQRSAKLILDKRAIPNLDLTQLLSAYEEMISSPTKILIDETLKVTGDSMIDLFGDPPLKHSGSTIAFSVMLAGFFSYKINGSFDLQSIYEKINRDLEKFDQVESQSKKEQPSILSQQQKLIFGFRRHSQMTGNAPTDKTADDDIILIYEKSTSAFKKIAQERNENLREGSLNFIAWKFMQIKEDYGNDFMEEHLNYEIEKYRAEGLRPDYLVDMPLN